MDDEVYLSEVERRSGARSREAAARLTEAVLESIGELLHQDDVRELEAHLPPRVVEQLRRKAREGDAELRDLLARVSIRTGLSQAQAVEAAQVVCAVLAEKASGEARAKLQRSLPGPLSRLFEPRPESPPYAPPRHAPETRFEPVGRTIADGIPFSPRNLSEGAPTNTLARGRPGSEHPIAESSSGRPK